MRFKTKAALVAAAAFSLLQASETQAQTPTSLDARVQAPQLTAPQRGSLAGQLSSVVFGPGDVARGAFTLASPFALPQERGAPLANLFPSYSPESGASEWGTGWQSSLAMTRSRLKGDLDYATDELTGPYGRLVQGTDGSWYPVGLSKPVRVEWAGDVITAYLPDGTKETYGGTARLATARGTYAWYLTSVETATGARTRLDWTANSTGRRFVTTVWYGGRGQDFEYRVDLAYETLNLPFEDYRSGQLVTLDRRVKSVVVNARNVQTGLFEERWHYELFYLAEGFGPGFFLRSVQQTFRSGELPPPVTYTYNRAAEKLGVTQFAEASKLKAVLDTLGQDALHPNKSTQLDDELNGLIDIEHSTSFRLARQTQTGFVFENLPPAPSDVYTYCRPSSSSTNEPRVLAQLRSGSADDKNYVVDLRPNADGTKTYFSACTREGQRLANQTLTGNWALGATVRLVDVNRDHQPDLVRVQNGSYSVVANTSTAESFSFGAEKLGALSPSVDLDTAWVNDFNGDGLADLIARYPDGLVVWYGKGKLDFDRNGRTFSLRTASGTSPGSLTTYGITFVDANKDGLTDLVLTSTTTSNSTSLYVNRGRMFQETSVPGLMGVDSLSSYPVVADFSGSGNTEVAFTRSNGKGYTVTLDAPGTGLLKSADDGRGTVLVFEYGRAAPAPGGRQRHTVLAKLTVSSSGYDTTAHTYTYGTPRLHSVGKFLVGFDSVQRDGPGVVHSVNFLNGNDFSGLLSSATRHDTLSPGVHTYEYRKYEDWPYQGIPFKRLEEEGSGWAQEDGQAMGEWVEYLAYEAEICPSKMVRHTPSGTLTTEKPRAQPSALTHHLHCLESGTRLTGVHPDAYASLNFKNEVRLIRNSVGLVERVEDVSAEGDIQELQEVIYRPDFLVDSITLPGKGTTHFEWEPGTQQLRRLTSPDGMIVEASSRHPVTSALLALTTWRGPEAYTQYFGFDGQERLHKQWNSLGTTSEAVPSSSHFYRYATATQPGSITTTALVDATVGASSSVVEWQSASGEAVAKAARIPDGWMVDGLTTRSRTLLETKQHVRPALGTGVDVSALDYASLLSGADVIGTLTTSGLGFEENALTRLHADVSRQTVTRLSVEEGLLKQEAVENGTHSTRRFLDAQKRLVAFEDEAHTRYTYTYDVLGRLREVRLPGGQGHRVHFDGHGRVDHVARDGIAQVRYAYQAGTGLLAAKTFLSTAGQAERWEDYVYDTIGRQTLVRHTEVGSGATQDYRFYYDGATPTAPARPEATGHLSAVEGEGFLKLFEYGPDGKPVRKTLRLNGWRTVDTVLTYREDGSVRQQQVCHHQADGTPLSCTTLSNTPDTFGRADLISLNGQTLADLQYNAQGQLSAASLEGGRWMMFTYDPLTRAPGGFSQAGPGLTSSMSWRFDSRGMLGSENLEVGGLSFSRTHAYSPQRFLSSSSDAHGAYAYEYDATGLPGRIEENGVSRTLVRNGNTLTAGTTTYTFDGLGRTTSRDDLVFTYGPNGHLARATRGTRTWDFVYDEAGQRLLKLEHGAPLAAYLESGMYLDDTGLTIPFKVGERLAGVIQNNAFRPLAADMRGTVLSDYEGTPRLASPYGTRTVSPESSAVLDYVEKGYDRDLGLIRMGVRDYDPLLGRFSTPDPLFLESPEKCAESPVECNLYGYAKGAPTLYADPTGRAAMFIPVVLFFVLVPMTDDEFFQSGATMAASIVAPAPTMGFFIGRGAAQLQQGNYNDAVRSFAGAVATGAGPAISSRVSNSAASATSRELSAGAGANSIVGVMSKKPAPGAEVNFAASASSEGNALTRVGRWMSNAEYKAMQSTGMVQESNAGGTTYVAHPADPTAYMLQAKPGSIYAEFDVPSAAIRPTQQGWARIIGPRTPEGRIAAKKGLPLPEMPPATNIEHVATKIP